MQSGECADQAAILELELPAEVLAALESEEAVEVDFGAVLLDLKRDAAVAAAIDHHAGEFTVLVFDLEGLPFLSLDAGFVGGDGNADPSANYFLGSKRAGDQNGNRDKPGKEFHGYTLYLEIGGPRVAAVNTFFTSVLTQESLLWIYHFPPEGERFDRRRKTVLRQCTRFGHRSRSDYQMPGSARGGEVC